MPGGGDEKPQGVALGVVGGNALHRDPALGERGGHPFEEARRSRRFLVRQCLGIDEPAVVIHGDVDVVAAKLWPRPLPPGPAARRELGQTAVLHLQECGRGVSHRGGPTCLSGPGRGGSPTAWCGRAGQTPRARPGAAPRRRSRRQDPARARCDAALPRAPAAIGTRPPPCVPRALAVTA